MYAPVLVRGVALLAATCGCVWAWPETLSPCEVRTRTESGWICGRRQRTEEGAVFASFLGVPYAKQPLGHRRFKELEPSDPWDLLYATEEGPACHQTDVVYGRIMKPQGWSEACIHANIHTPIQALPGAGFEGSTFKKLPILVFVHGGGFQGGSGDTDLHGPQYLLGKDVVVVTFNYRLNVFGFLSLDSPEIPGNQGLRDQVTLLNWVRRNARFFGGDPENITLMGQSAGAISVHLLTLSKVTERLYKRAFLMSGTSISGFFTASPVFAKQLSATFLGILGINATDPPAEIHQRLIEMPVEMLTKTNQIMLDQIGLTTFMPTVESEFPGVTRILDEDPEILLAKGRGKNVPLVIGFTNVECETFRHRIDQIDFPSKIVETPILTVPANIIFTTPSHLLLDIAKTIDRQYYNGTIDTDGFLRYCTDSYFKYPALKLAEIRQASGGADVFLYQFAYNSEDSVLKRALDLNYTSAAHIEDLTYVFRVNSMLPSVDAWRPPKTRDDYIIDRMTTYLVNFMHCSAPDCYKRPLLPQARSERLQIQEIWDPTPSMPTGLTEGHRSILRFFDSLRQ